MKFNYVFRNKSHIYLTILLFFMLSFSVAYGQAEYRVDEISDGTSISVVDGDRIYDSGGDDENYDSNEDYTVTFCVSTDSFIILNLEAVDIDYYTTLEIYEGENTEGTKLSNIGSSTSGPITLQSLASCVTIYMKGSSWAGDTGFEIEVATVAKSDLIVQDGATHNDVCSAVFYDSGGPVADYGHSESSATTFCAEDGEYVVIDFNLLDISSGDNLMIYDGTSTSGTLIATLTNLSQNDGSGLLPFQSSSSCLTVEFMSNSYTARDGWIANVTCTDVASPILTLDGGTHDVCNGYILDSGGLLGDYSNNESDNVTTFCAAVDQHMVITLESIEISSSDTLFIYDGIDANAPLLGQLTNFSNSTTTFRYQSYTNCLSMRFSSNNYGTGNGWLGTIECVGNEPADFINSGGTYDVCEGTFTDIGRTGYGYMKNESDRPTTFCAGSGAYAKLEFTYLDIANGDQLAIYDGTSTSGALLGTFTNLNENNGVPKVKIKNLPEADIKISISHTERQAIAFAIYDKKI